MDEAYDPFVDSYFKYTDLDTTSGEFGLYGEGKLIDVDNDNEDGVYDENSTFTYCGEQISMMDFEALRKEILGE